MWALADFGCLIARKVLAMQRHGKPMLSEAAFESACSHGWPARSPRSLPFRPLTARVGSGTTSHSSVRRSSSLSRRRWHPSPPCLRFFPRWHCIRLFGCVRRRVDFYGVLTNPLGALQTRHSSWAGSPSSCTCSPALHGSPLTWSVWPPFGLALNELCRC